jgi:PAS domain S-box-containing protein
MLIENTQEMIIFFDSDGKISDCNKKAIQELGYGEDIYEIPIYNIFKKAFKYEVNKLELNTKFHNRAEETIAYRKNQTCFTVELNVTIISEKRFYIGLCTAIDVSEKKEAFREVKHLKNDLISFNQIRNEFIANITHELRTPVNGIMGLSDNLLESELKPRQLETVNLIKRCCSNMNTIINDLLDFAKISNNKMLIEQREFSFRDLIQHIIDFNKIRINEKGLKLLVNVSSDIPDRVIGDELRLTQILNNLFSNAVKFTSTGQIALEVYKTLQTDQFIELFFMIIDTGIGISLEDKDKLFQSFSQVDGSITRRFGGTGLGLSISKMLVEAMQGTIAVDSEEGKGSTFSFSIHLELPQTLEEQSEDLSASDISLIFYDEKGNPHMKNEKDSYVIPCLNSLNKIMKEADRSEFEVFDGINAMEEAEKVFVTALEKLSICIEMENWDKAEELAYYIKKLTPSDYGDITKSVFRLLLSVRKENHDVSLEIINELMTVINERKCNG